MSPDEKRKIASNAANTALANVAGKLAIDHINDKSKMTPTLDEQIAFVEHAMLGDVRDNAEFVAVLASLRQLRDSQSGAEPVAWIEYHKAGQNLNWEPVDHPYAKATPLYAHPPVKSGAEPVAWMTEDGRVINASTKNRGMPKAVEPSYCIPLFANPPGVSVPEEPTEEMIEALYGKYLSPTCHKSRIEGYKAMLAAAKK